MTNQPPELLKSFDCSEEAVRKTVADTLGSADDGELYMEYSQSEGLVFDNGKLKTGSFDTNQGFGLRAVAGEAAAYAHAGEMSEAALKRAAEAVKSISSGHSGSYAAAPRRTNTRLYPDDNPIGAPSFEEKVKLLQDIDAYARSRDEKVRQVSASVAGSWQVVEILRADGEIARDIRPLVRLNVSIVVGKGERQETGSHGHRRAFRFR